MFFKVMVGISTTITVPLWLSIGSESFQRRKIKAIYDGSCALNWIMIAYVDITDANERESIPGTTQKTGVVLSPRKDFLVQRPSVGRLTVFSRARPSQICAHFWRVQNSREYFATGRQAAPRMESAKPVRIRL